MIKLKDLLVEKLKAREVAMVDGIVEIVRMVKDIDNRKKIADKMIRNFKKENIEFDYNTFLTKCGLKEK